MEKYQCRCQYVYDPAAGDGTQEIVAGTSFEMLPGDWICPMCGSEKSNFLKEVGRPNSEMGHPKINVKVKCFSTLAKEKVCGFRADTEYELSDGATVHDLTEKLELPMDSIKLIFLNNREVDSRTVLHSGDRVGFSPVTGGM